MKQKTNWNKLLPVLLSFVVMGFVDIIGVATGYIKQDFELTNFAAQFLPMMVLLWFFVLSVPAGILQDKLGKRNMLNAGMIIQAVGLGLPFVHYSFAMMFASFLLLGVGNTLIQVSSNPLLQDVSPEEKLPSFLSAGQFIKAIISFAGPLLATFLAIRFDNWKLVLAVYGVISVLAAAWLAATPIAESKSTQSRASFKSCFGLLKNRFVAIMALSIFMIVGAEVAINTNIADILIARFDLTLEKAAIGISVFFAGETVARLTGAIVLNWIKPRPFLLLIALVALVGIAGVLLAPAYLVAFVFIFVAGLGAGSMFPVIFSLALEKMSERSNEISGLLIMAVSGGAVIPPIVGLVSTFVSPVASVFVIGFCMLYILWVSLYVKRK
ncbi:Fucose permease [Mariniphaga anaerophila]|uniref:Fucose permease n=1 Tax=Mariniphaga anaerophila TaxID=1484053 RepID=A0A1M5AP87_9BACT|nr:MFS transporter [Mariniphaga anaerophila]SHF32078.1 Fucose permease [Mariniphaga anaerophila]